MGERNIIKYSSNLNNNIMTTIFIILAIVFVALIIWLGCKWNKTEEHLNLPVNNGGAINGGGNQSSVSPIIGIPRFSILRAGYGRNGWFEQGETFYTADYGQNSVLFLEVKVDELNTIANLVKLAGNAFPAIQFGCVTNPTPCYESCEVQNEQRQTLQSQLIRKGDIFYLACPVLIHQNERGKYYTVTLRYRVDNGNGWSAWENTDAITIHKV